MSLRYTPAFRRHKDHLGTRPPIMDARVMGTVPDPTDFIKPSVHESLSG